MVIPLPILGKVARILDFRLTDRSLVFSTSNEGREQRAEGKPVRSCEKCGLGQELAGLPKSSNFSREVEELVNPKGKRLTHLGFLFCLRPHTLGCTDRHQGAMPNENSSPTGTRGMPFGLTGLLPDRRVN